MADGYQAQLGVTGGPTLQGADPEAFGAATGRALEFAGEKMDQAIHQHREIQRDTEAADAGVALARASTAIDQQAIDARDNAAPGGAGHTDGVSKSIDEVAQANLGAIKDPHIRAQFQGRYAELRDRVTTREYGWEATARVGKLVSDVDEQGTHYADKEASNPSVGSFVQSIGDVATTVGALAGVGDDVKHKLVREQQRKIAVAFGNGLQEKNPHALIDALDKGTLNDYLEPEDIKTLRSGGMVEIRRLEAAALQKDRQAEADARENGQFILNRIGKGDFTVTDKEFEAASEAAKKYDLKELGFNLAVGRDKRDVLKETRDWTPVQWHSEINRLAAKGDKLTQGESVRLSHLRELGPGAMERFNSDPFAAAANAGNAPPPLDLENPDPAAIEKRVTWARSYARATGLQSPPYLSNDELKIYRDRATQGTAGQIEIGSTLRKTFGVGVGSEIARQLAPNDKSLQLYVGLEPQAAVMVASGIEALKRNPKLFAGGDGDADRARDIWGEYASGIPQELQGPVYEAAKNITASAGDRVHRSSLEGAEFEATFRNAIQRAAGQIGVGNGATGGFVNWNGRRAWLPPTMGQTEFQQRLSRATPNDWKHVDGGAPHYMGPNGKLTPLSDDQLKQLGKYQLESSSPGVFQVTKDGGHLVDEHGRPWSFDVRKLR